MKMTQPRNEDEKEDEEVEQWEEGEKMFSDLIARSNGDEIDVGGKDLRERFGHTTKRSDAQQEDNVVHQESIVLLKLLHIHLAQEELPEEKGEDERREKKGGEKRRREGVEGS